MCTCALRKQGMNDLDGFMGRGFTSGRQELGSMLNATVCKIQASKHYIESLPLVLKEERS